MLILDIFSENNDIFPKNKIGIYRQVGCVMPETIRSTGPPKPET